LSKAGKSCRIKMPASTKVQTKGTRVKVKVSETGLIEFDTKAGQKYELILGK
jgi:hypothetical protein